MKRKSVKLLLCSALLVMALMISACGGKTDEKEAAKDTPTPTEEVKEEEPTEAPTEAPVEEEAPADDVAKEGRIADTEEDSEFPTEKFASVKEFAESDMLQAELEGLKASLEGSGMEITISGEDNKLIYTYTLLDTENVEGLGEQLSEAISAEAEAFQMIAASIKEAVDVENPVVVVTYLDCNGDEICSVEFAAE